MEESIHQTTVRNKLTLSFGNFDWCFYYDDNFTEKLGNGANPLLHLHPSALAYDLAYPILLNVIAHWNHSTDHVNMVHMYHFKYI